MKKLYANFYLHSDSEYNWDDYLDALRTNGLEKPQDHDNIYTTVKSVAYEVEFFGYWTEDGRFFAMKMNDYEFEEPIEL